MAENKSDLLMKFVGPKGDIAAGGQAVIDQGDTMLNDFKTGKYFEIESFELGFELNDFETDGAQAAAPRFSWVAAGKFANWRTPRDDNKPLQISYPVEAEEFSFTRLIDQASPNIFQSCANSAGFSKAVLVKRRPAFTGMQRVGPGRTEAGSGLRGFLRIEFDQILITGLGWDDGEMVKEKCKFICRSVLVRYRPQASSGALAEAAEKTAQWQQQMELRKPSGQ